MTRRSRPVLVGLALSITCLLLFLALAPQAQAQNLAPGFGEIVQDLSADTAEHEIATSGAPDQVSFRDADGDGSIDSDEAVFLAQGSTTEAGDVRLANPSEGQALSKISTGDADAGLEVATMSGQIRFFDADRSGYLSEDDPVYFDRDDSRSGQVSANDVVLAGPNAGQLVAAGNEHFGNGLETLRTSPSFGYYDEASDGDYHTTDAAVVDVDADGWMSVGDVRLTSTNASAGGTIVASSDADVTYRLEGFDETWTFQHRDPDGSGDYGTSEAAFITSGSDVATFAVRIANPPSDQASGSQVVEQDSDWNIGTVDLSGSMAHDGDGDLDRGASLYQDVDGNDEVDRGDIRLTGNDAGEVVTGGDDDIGNALSAYDGDLAYFDANGNGVYDGADIVYADTGNDDIVKSFDVQLSGAADPYASDDGDDGGETDEPASISITEPANGTELTAGENVTIAGTADAGTDASIDEVSLSVTGGNHTLGDVEGTSNWSAPFTPEETATFTIEATVTPSSGEETTDAITLNATERDTDGDGVPDRQDNCPETTNPDQADRDDDGTGDACDDDRDGDGIANDADQCPDEAGEPADDGCPITPEDPGEGNETPTDGEQPPANETPDEGNDSTNGTDGQEGVPTVGAGWAALAIASTAIAVRCRRRES